MKSLFPLDDSMQKRHLFASQETTKILGQWHNKSGKLFVLMTRRLYTGLLLITKQMSVLCMSKHLVALP
jgi:hypothetical protein